MTDPAHVSSGRLSDSMNTEITNIGLIGTVRLRRFRTADCLKTPVLRLICAAVRPVAPIFATGLTDRVFQNTDLKSGFHASRLPVQPMKLDWKLLRSAAVPIPASSCSFCNPMPDPARDDAPEFDLESDGLPEDFLVPYWNQAREPLACLVFLIPLLALYELGVFWFGGNQPLTVRNGADYWLRSGLASLGIEAFLLPLLIIGGLLGWHRYGGYRWRLSRETLVGMFAESMILAVCLLFVAQLQDMAFQCWFPSEFSIHGQGSEDCPLLVIAPNLGSRMVSYVGAGVYEEVLFRLLLLPACFAFLRGVFRMPGSWSAVLAVFLTSLTFSVAHYVGASGETFSLFSFTFRTTAGCFFATVFLLRGFGITVGCHAFYDLMVGILTASEF